MIGNLKKRNDCKPCKRKQLTAEQKKHVGLFTGIMLALLPKCPFCFMAFSSTMILCENGISGVSSHTFASTTTLFFTAFFCLVTLLSILLNFRDARTKYALLVATLGTLLLVLSVTVGGGLLLYYLGVLVVFSGVWLNGSLLFFVGRIRDYLRHKMIDFQL
jgi:hypothetical protein